MIRTATGPGGLRHLPPRPPSPFAAALGPPPGARSPGSAVGVEHEYSLSTLSGERLDFRQMIHDLPVPGRRLDPGDLNAYRCPSGLAITCDAEDAEVVSPPLAVHPGFAAEVAAWAAHGRSELIRLLPAGIAVTPFSTHISASMPAALVDGACELFARTFAPALALLLGGADSHGVFVRPRPGRLEVCGEHVLGARLGAAATLVAGGARACAAALGPPAGAEGGHLPPLLAVDVRPARGRRGLFVGRNVAFGQDLLDAGRDGDLPLLGGGTVPAADHLRAVWDCVRTALSDDAGPADFRAVDAIVAGATPVEPQGADGIGPSPFGDVVEARRRPGFEAAAVAATWDFTVFRLTGTPRQAYACVPGALLRRFLDRLDAGAVDGLVTGFLDAPSTGQVLTAHDETMAPGLWDGAVIGPDLLPYEQSAAEAAIEASGSLLYVRRGKGAVVLTHPAPIMSSPISAGGPPAPGVSGSPVSPMSDVPRVVPVAPVARPAPEIQRPPVPAAVVAVLLTDSAAVPTIIPGPVESPVPPTVPPAVERRRPRGLVLAGAFLVLLLAAGAAAMAGALSGGKPTAVEVVTGPTSPSTSPSTSPNVTVAPSTASTAEPTTTTLSPTTAIPPPTVATGPPPTAATTVPPTTLTSVPVQTTVLMTTTVVTTTTTVSPSQLVVGVASGALGCVFQPPTATVPQGSSVRFRNDTPGPIAIVFPTLGAATRINLDAGGTSGPMLLGAAGSYTVTCTPGGDAVVGRMTLTVIAT